MARPYSTKFLIGLANADSERVGVQLAKVCVDAKLPANSIADFFGVSRMAVHKWFRGQYIREEKCIKIQRFITQIKEDLQKEALPAGNIKSAKEYLTSIQPNII
jgi:hypothetical protein|tara:strand:- start:3925 stop:4236 length:312 start_codon:yes stop_codon:yes gene_type:complete